MPVGYQGFPKMFPVAGFRLGTASAGIKKPGRRDVVVMAPAEGSRVAAVFTRNAFCAAPVVVAREHLGQAVPRYLLVNTGNANAGTGEQGMLDARGCCSALAAEAGCEASEVLPFSTGVIGEPLPVEKITAAIPAAMAALDENGWEEAAHGILTTDTVPKGASVKLALSAGEVTVTGIAKGSGMIRPDMATMLAYIATDAALDDGQLDSCLRRAVNASFNRITVDGDTSTNDACVLVATGASGISPNGDELEALQQALDGVLRDLAQLIIRDGEGASKFITIDVRGGRDGEECLAVAYTVAHSPLVKTAFFASDPNWGRILAAVGRAGVVDMDLEAITIDLDEVRIVSNGGRDADYSEDAGQAVMGRDEITIAIDLARGEAREQVWTSDLSHEYVRINAEYRT